MIRFLLKILLSLYALYAIALLGAAFLIAIVPKIPQCVLSAFVLLLAASPVLIVAAILPTALDARRKARASLTFEAARASFASRVAPQAEARAAGVERETLFSLKALLIALPLLYGVNYVAARIDSAHERRIESAGRYSAVPTDQYPVPYDHRISKWRNSTFFVTHIDRAIHRSLFNVRWFVFAVGLVGTLAVLIEQARRQLSRWRGSPGLE